MNHGYEITDIHAKFSPLNHERKVVLEDLRHYWKDNIKMGHKEIALEGVV
jgi:hypothetical protein